jgi:hypothetical protein
LGVGVPGIGGPHTLGFKNMADGLTKRNGGVNSTPPFLLRKFRLVFICQQELG